MRVRILSCVRVLALLVAVLSAAAPLWPGSARATSTPPPTPVGSHESPSPFPTVLHTPRPRPAPPRTSAAAAVLVDRRTGQILYGKDGTQKRPVASLTKIMTALLTLRRANLSDVITVDRETAHTPPSNLSLKVGEELTVRDLLDGLLLSSANDAAVALAEHVSGSVPAFVALMNRAARHLGMRHTHFASPNGLLDSGYSTARDMAKLTAAAYRIPEFRRLVDAKFATIPGAAGKPDRVLQNRNVLLWLYRGATGVKTGFTVRAGWCLIAEANRGGRSLLTVILHAPTQGASFSDGAMLLNYGFSEFQPSLLAVPGETAGTVLLDGEPLTAAAADRLVRLVRRDRLEDVMSAFVPDPGVALPVAKGDRIGVLRFRTGRAILGSVPLVATEAAAAPPPGAPAPPPASLGPPVESALHLLYAVGRSTLGSLL